MQQAKKIALHVCVILCFLLLSFNSIDLAFCTFSVFIFITILNNSDIDYSLILTISVFFDVYTFNYIGITFVSFIFILILTQTVKAKVINSPTILKLCYFCLFLLVSKIIKLILTEIVGGTFCIVSHLYQILTSAVLCGTYYLIKSMSTRIRAVLYV